MRLFRGPISNRSTNARSVKSRRSANLHCSRLKVCPRSSSPLSRRSGGRWERGAGGVRARSGGAGSEGQGRWASRLRAGQFLSGDQGNSDACLDGTSLVRASSSQSLDTDQGNSDARLPGAIAHTVRRGACPNAPRGSEGAEAGKGFPQAGKGFPRAGKGFAGLPSHSARAPSGFSCRTCGSAVAYPDFSGPPHDPAEAPSGFLLLPFHSRWAPTRILVAPSDLWSAPSRSR
jgi:hypothetical protein